MNRKQLILLVVVCLVLGGLALFFTRSRQAEFSSGGTGIGDKLLGDFPANDVAHVVIKAGDGEVNLVKQEVWVVKERSNYPASFSQVAELVRKLWELKPVQSQQVGASQWGRLDLLPPDTKDAGTNTATLVDLKGKDGKTIRSLLLGKKQMRDTDGQFGGYPVGRWLALPGNKDTVYVANETFSDVEPKPESWLDKDFFKVDKIKAISLVSTNATHSWSLDRTNETSDWVLKDATPGEELDKSKLSSFNYAFSSPSFNDVYPKDSAVVKDAFTHPTAIHIDTFGGFHYDINVGSQPDNDSYYLTVAATADLPTERVVPAGEKPEDKEKNEKTWKDEQEKLKEKLKKEKSLDNWVYKVSKWTADSVLKERHALMAEKKPETNLQTTGTTGTHSTNAPPDPLAIPALPSAPPTAPEK